MRRFVTLGVGALLFVGTLVACGKSGSSSGGATGASGGCVSRKGSQLVVLTDDKHLQLSDNVVPAVNAAAASPALLADLDKVSAALDTAGLRTLNGQTDVERKTPADAAAGFVRDHHLTEGLQKGSGSVKIGVTTFNETQSVGNIYAAVLNAAGFQASVTTPIANREVYEPDLEHGGITVVPEYAATLTEFLNQKLNGPSAAAKASAQIATTMQALTGLGDKVGLKFGTPSSAVDANAFAVTKQFSTANHVRTLSDLATRCNGGKLVLGGVTECKNRPFCLPGLEKTYGVKFSGFRAFGESFPLIKTALKQGVVQVGLVLSSDAGLSAP